MENLIALFRFWMPDIVVVAVSSYSPYRSRAETGTPFGATLPLQLPIALNASKAAHASGISALLLNACYPELVNPIARLLGTPFDVGLGNAQTLNWEQNFGEADGLHALAHHSHLGTEFVNEPLMYDATNVRVHEAENLHIEALKRRRGLSRAERNDLGATAAAALVARLTTLPRVTACVPGFGAETGAVPVTLGLSRKSKPRIELSDTDLNRVRARHRQECLSEGWIIRDDAVELTPEARNAMANLAPPSLRLSINDLNSWVNFIGRSL
ncbi:hypothetical protein LNV09_03215 [Paucibacter sp. B2R-40]|uniref:hypothetical protein n=1 Tax=Paucibacter sp. B2R-40 TaxID=2893554 RepID=UPI0021E48F54|nr:hypothetical protein [Paucibacter sp. B2R-40]MCV2353168.1 hypothetical protein [Paucibacter sp. B2R-40]